MSIENLDIEYRGHRIRAVRTSSPIHFRIGVFDPEGAIANFCFQPLPVISTEMLDETIEDCIENHKKTIDKFTEFRDDA